jgi:hypothetical protein
MRMDCGLTVLTLRPATEKPKEEPSGPRYNTVAIVTGLRGRVIVDIIRCPDLRDKRQSISKISYGLSLSTGGSLTWR